MATEDEITASLRRILANKQTIEEASREIAHDEARIAQLRNDSGDRTIEQHLLAIAPAEGFDMNDITDGDRRQIARVVLDAHQLGTAWLTRDADLGFKREDPLRVEVRDRRMT